MTANEDPPSSIGISSLGMTPPKASVPRPLDCKTKEIFRIFILALISARMSKIQKHGGVQQRQQIKEKTYHNDLVGRVRVKESLDKLPQLVKDPWCAKYKNCGQKLGIVLGSGVVHDLK